MSRLCFETRESAEEACQATSASALVSYIIGPTVQTPDELEICQSIRESFLITQEFYVAIYRRWLKRQAREKAKASMRTILVALAPVKSVSDDDWLFMSWARKA